LASSSSSESSSAVAISSVLDKANVTRLLPEALAAEVEPVFADQAGPVRADSAGAIALAKCALVRVPELSSHVQR